MSGTIQLTGGNSIPCNSAAVKVSKPKRVRRIVELLHHGHAATSRATSFQSLPSGAAMMRTRRPAAPARAASAFAASRPGRSPSAAMTKFPQATRPADVRQPCGAQAGPDAATAACKPSRRLKPVSTPSHATSGPDSSARRTAPPAQMPSASLGVGDVRLGRVGRQVRAMHGAEALRSIRSVPPAPGSAGQSGRASIRDGSGDSSGRWHWMAAFAAGSVSASVPEMGAARVPDERAPCALRRSASARSPLHDALGELLRVWRSIHRTHRLNHGPGGP